MPKALFITHFSFLNLFCHFSVSIKPYLLLCPPCIGNQFLTPESEMPEAVGSALVQDSPAAQVGYRSESAVRPSIL